MYEVVFDALVDTVEMVPLMLIIYIGIEFIEYKFGRIIREKVKTAGKTGPLLGAGFGIVPQCGFSVISTALYTQRLISAGTLMAVYISTSDEAVPIILAQPHQAGIIFPLLAAKLIIALMAGYTVDLIFRKSKALAESETCAASSEDCAKMPAELHADQAAEIVSEEGCCGHNLDKPNYRQLLLHPLVHTMKVVVFVFAVSLALNLIMVRVGSNLQSIMLGKTIFQPLVVGLVGLIPNCAASVAIAELFIKGGISFGSAVAGLSAGSGLGLLVLLRENHSFLNTAKIIGILYGISVVSGILIQYFYR